MTKLKKPEKEDGKLLLFERLLGMGEPGSEVIRQERRGNRDLVNSTALPTQGLNKQKLEKMGFEVYGPFEDDPIFTDTKFPEGWSRKLINDLHSEVLDDKGRVRLVCFYKAAFYDRGAHISFVRRFDVHTLGFSFLNHDNHISEDDFEEYYSKVVIDKLKSKVVLQYKVPGRKPSWEEESLFNDKCYKWLAENYPKYEDSTEYWEEG